MLGARRRPDGAEDGVPGRPRSGQGAAPDRRPGAPVRPGAAVPFARAQGQIEQGGVDVLRGQEARVAPPAGGPPRGVDDERDVPGGAEEGGFEEQAVVPEQVAVVGGEEHHRASGDAQLLERAPQPADGVVDQGDVAGVHRPGALHLLPPEGVQHPPAAHLLVGRRQPLQVRGVPDGGRKGARVVEPVVGLGRIVRGVRFGEAAPGEEGPLRRFGHPPAQPAGRLPGAPGGVVVLEGEGRAACADVVVADAVGPLPAAPAGGAQVALVGVPQAAVAPGLPALLGDGERLEPVGLVPGREVHLAECPGGVSGASERRREGDALGRDGHAGVAPHADGHGAAAGHHGVAGGDADRHRAVGVGEGHPLGGEGVQVRRAHRGVAGEPEEVPPQLVGGDEQDVEPALPV